MKLTLAEELLLIALDDKRGKLITSSNFSLDFCLSGAILFDLTFGNQIILREKTLEIASEIEPEDAIMKQAYQIIAQKNKSEDMQFWINELCEKITGIRYAILENLVAKDVLYKVEKKLLKIFSNPRYLPKNGELEYAVRARIREIILHNQPHDIKSTMLIALVNTADLVEELFPALNDLKIAREWIKKISVENNVHISISNTLKEIQKAVDASIIVPAIVRA
ncbi:MAG: GPP34 family phosphoprotein [Bacteroidota bacterium]